MGAISSGYPAGVAATLLLYPTEVARSNLSPLTCICINCGPSPKPCLIYPTAILGGHDSPGRAKVTRRRQQAG